MIFVKQEIPTPEKVALAQKYMLPKTFYLYENKPPCPGCLGCADDMEGTTVKSSYIYNLLTTGNGNVMQPESLLVSLN